MTDGAARAVDHEEIIAPEDVVGQQPWGAQLIPRLLQPLGVLQLVHGALDVVVQVECEYCIHRRANEELLLESGQCRYSLVFGAYPSGANVDVNGFFLKLPNQRPTANGNNDAAYAGASCRS